MVDLEMNSASIKISLYHGSVYIPLILAQGHASEKPQSSYVGLSPFPYYIQSKIFYL